MEVFVVSSNLIERRLDPHYYRPIFIDFEKKLSKRNFDLIDDISNVICGPFGSAILVSDYRESGTPLIRISNINSNGELVFTDVTYIENDLSEKLSNYKVAAGDIVISQRGTLGLTAIVTNEFNNAVISANFIAIKNIKRFKPKFLKYFFDTEIANIQLQRRVSGQVQIKLTTDDIKTIKVPKIDDDAQNKIIQIMDEAYARKKQNEEEAERLLNSYTELVNEFVDIDLNISAQRKIFIVHFEEFGGALNPERYANRLTLHSKYTWKPINNFGDVIRDTFTPSRSDPEDEFGLIRIDDLPSNPQEAEIRDVKGIEINGIILKVQRNDVLVARLGPTLENKKTIIVPDYPKELIASNEFICLRCHENINPIFVLVMLKTDFYKNLMIQKSRGATPSRRRLSHEDFAELPFPKIDKPIQDKIAEKFIEQIKKAKQLKQEATEALDQAKKEVEKILFEQAE